MKFRSFLLAMMLCALCVTQASALEYTFDAPEDYLFGQPTSDDTIYEWENPNVDRSKNAALIAPGFGTPTSYLPGSGEYLTPNLVPGALSGGLVNQVGSANINGGTAGSSVIPGQYPSVSGNVTMTQVPGGSPTDIAQGSTSGGYTEVTDDLYYSNGSLGALKIPAINLTVKVYQGTDSTALKKGVGHFTNTSIWDGNACFAGHNRGVNNHFGKIHTLEAGDTITLTTALGTRTYAVTSVEKVSVNDSSGTAPTTDNRVTLYTSLKDQTYRPNPARRTYIAKKNNPAKQRPLGIPSTNDKLVQEIIRMLLEAIYEPTFSDRSHGFRPKRSCHTALSQIKDTFTGVRWIVEGDIKGCFDNFDHHVLIDILRRRIKDEAFLSLMWKFLKAGYMEQWEYHKTYSGTPQGSGMSPILANIYLSELDTFMDGYKACFDKGTSYRKPSKEYGRIAGRYRRAKKKLDAGDHSKEAVQEFKAAQKLKLSMPYADVLDADFKRIQYNRYADDFVVGVIGSKQDALSIKEDLRRFLSEKLKLTLSEEKTKVTHSSEAVRYLGYDIRVVRNKSAKRCKNGALRRVWYGQAFLYVPHEKWENKLHELRAMQVKWDENRGRNFWRPMHRNELVNSTDVEIVSQYNSEIRGLYNFYRIAENVGVLSKFYYMMRYSMLKTYAGKYRTNVSKIKRKYMHNGIFQVPYTTKSGPKLCEFYHDGFRKQDKGYDNVQDLLPRYLHYDGRNTLAKRLKAGICELCGNKTDDIRMHHVRALKKLTGKTEAERLMLHMRRKSLALCPYCYQSTLAQEP